MFTEFNEAINVLLEGGELSYEVVADWTDEYWHKLRKDLQSQGYNLIDNSSGFKAIANG